MPLPLGTSQFSRLFAAIQRPSPSSNGTQHPTPPSPYRTHLRTSLPPSISPAQTSPPIAGPPRSSAKLLKAAFNPPAPSLRLLPPSATRRKRSWSPPPPASTATATVNCSTNPQPPVQASWPTSAGNGRPLPSQPSKPASASFICDLASSSAPATARLQKCFPSSGSASAARSVPDSNV